MAEYEKARKEFKKAISLNSGSGLAYRFLGDCYAALNMIDKAITTYKKGLTLAPNDAASLSALGWLFHLQGENSEIALSFCQQSVEISPDFGLYRHRLGRLLIGENRLPDALKELEAAHKLGSNSKKYIRKIKDKQNT